MKTVLAPLLLSLTIIFMSCEKKQEGCTDITADNYSQKVNNDDGSCLYSAEISFWYDSDTQDSLISNNCSSIAPFISGEKDNYINVYPDFLVWSAAPDCSSNVIKLKASLGSLKSGWVKFGVSVDSLSNVFWQDSTYLVANDCDLYQIVW